jgi:hypothetical protein
MFGYPGFFTTSLKLQESLHVSELGALPLGNEGFFPKDFNAKHAGDIFPGAFVSHAHMGYCCAPKH